MKALVGAVLACLALQQGPSLSRLGDDSPEVRERATAEFVHAGRAAEGELQRALGDRDPEVRARAAQVLGEIERFERRREFEPGPSRITIRREDATLGEIVAEIRAQSRTAVRLAPGLEDRLVTAAFERVPLFSALEELCRAAGGLSFTAESGVSIERSPEARSCARDEFVFWSAPARIYGGVVSLALFAGWETGTRPWAASIRVEEVVDGAGNAYGAAAVRS